MGRCEYGWKVGKVWHSHGVQDQKGKQVKCKVPGGLVTERLEVARLG